MEWSKKKKKKKEKKKEREKEKKRLLLYSTKLGTTYFCRHSGEWWIVQTGTAKGINDWISGNNSSSLKGINDWTSGSNFSSLKRRKLHLENLEETEDL